MDAEHRDAEHVDDVAIDCDRVITTRKAFAKPSKIQRRDRIEQRRLERLPEAGCAPVEIRASPPALESVPAQERFRLRPLPCIPEPHNVDAIRAARRSQ